jgi:hypothetical protein
MLGVGFGYAPFTYVGCLFTFRASADEETRMPRAHTNNPSIRDVVLLLAMTMEFSLIDSLRIGKCGACCRRSPAQTCVSQWINPRVGKYSGRKPFPQGTHTNDHLLRSIHISSPQVGFMLLRHTPQARCGRLCPLPARSRIYPTSANLSAELGQARVRMEWAIPLLQHQGMGDGFGSSVRSRKSLELAAQTIDDAAPIAERRLPE